MSKPKDDTHRGREAEREPLETPKIDECFDNWYCFRIGAQRQITAVTVSDRLAAHLGRESGFFVAPPWLQLCPSGSQSEVNQRLQLLMSGENDTREVCIELPSGEVLWFEDHATVHRDNHGEVLSIVGVMFDVDRRVRRMQDLLDIEGWFGDFVLSSPDWVFETDCSLNFNFSNEISLRLFGISSTEILSRTLLELFQPESLPEISDLIASLLKSHEHFGRLVLPLPPDTTGPRWVELTLRPFANINGIFSGFRGAGRDITSARRENQELKRAKELAEEASRAKDEFLANVSHELRTPMTGVLGTIDLMLAEKPQALFEENLLFAKRSAESLLALIDDLLDIAKMEAKAISLQSEIFDIHQVLVTALESVAIRAKKAGIELVYDAAADIPWSVVGDPVRTRQIFINLVGNAIKFTHQGGIVVRVRTKQRSINSVILHCEVEDSGAGIPIEAQKKLFQRFVQLDASSTRTTGGTGLGLAISAKLIELMGGSIRLTSEPSRGTTFQFDITLGIDKTYEPASTGPLQKKAVLLYSDGKRSNQALLNLLLGWQMIVCEPKDEHELIENSAQIDYIVIDRRSGSTKLIERLQASGFTGRFILLRDVGDAMFDSTSNTTVEVRRPYSPATLFDAFVRKEAVQKPIQPELPMPITGTLSILVVEDNAVNRHVLRGLLSWFGHKVTLAENGVEAVSAAAEADFDLIFMDVQMPEMDGIEATKHILSNRKDAPPIYAVSASIQGSDYEEALAVGMKGLIAKPISITQLKTILELVLKSKVGLGDEPSIDQASVKVPCPQLK